MTGVVQWVGTWVIFILALMLLARTSWGRPIVAGLIWLAILILILAHSEEITGFFNPQALALNG